MRPATPTSGPAWSSTPPASRPTPAPALAATPEEVWHSRPPRTAPERADFRASVAGFQDQARWDQHLPLAGELCCSDQAAVDRIALRRALVAHDLLWFRRRRIPAPMEQPKVTLGG